MNNMKFSIVFSTGILFFYSSYQVAADAVKWTSLQVTFTKDKAGQWRIPLTVSEDVMMKNEYRTLSNHEEFPSVIIRCLPENPQVCPMYDKYQRLCGLRVGYPKKDLDKRAPGKMPYQYDKIPIFKQGTAYNIPIFYTDVLFDSPASLKKGGAATRNEPVGNSLWIKLDGKSWTSIPRKQADIEKNSDFVKQSCYPTMGQHFFYKLDKNTPCVTATPFFALYQGGEMVGCGLVPFGSFTSTNRVWFEDVPVQIVPAIFNNYGSCIKDYVTNYGVISLHIYMTSKPITCP